MPTFYKFRSADRLEYVLDILVNNRIYCAPFADLNDPMEGEYGLNWPTPIPDRNAFVRHHHQIRTEREHMRVCSLTQRPDFLPLWAYYASNFRGMALEVEFPEDDPCLHKVAYSHDLTIEDLHDKDPRSVAIESLCMKRTEWHHEQEYRVIIDDREDRLSPFHYLGKRIQKVIVTDRTPKAIVEGLKPLLRERSIQICALLPFTNGPMIIPVP